MVFGKSTSLSVNFLWLSAHHCDWLSGSGYHLTVSDQFTVAKIVEVKTQRPWAATLAHDMWIKGSARIVVSRSRTAILFQLSQSGYAIRYAGTQAQQESWSAIVAVIVKTKSSLLKAIVKTYTTVPSVQPPFETKWRAGDAGCGLTLAAELLPTSEEDQTDCDLKRI